MKKYSVFIGRLQPIHFGHIKIIKEALSQTDQLIIVLGGHNLSLTPRNPWTTDERRKMIQLACEDEGIDFSRIRITAVENNSYNDQAWLRNVRKAVEHTILSEWSPDPFEVNLIGHKKDRTSFYIDLFPGWGNIGVSNHNGLNATDLREIIFEEMGPYSGFNNKLGLKAIDYLPPSVENYIAKWADTEIAERLRREYVMIREYKKDWIPGGKKLFIDPSRTNSETGENYPIEVQVGPPYPVSFNTVDAIVVQAGHILMITRGAMPGEGLLALPGGFVDPSETLLDACLRELQEETKIDVPERTLRRCVVKAETFDDPHRSQRGRTINRGFFIDLGAKGRLPKVKGSDDAVKAQWIPIDKLDGNKIFEDHHSIIKFFLGIE
jgi:bifunctional NMN adenylyltransferase/nudix hydrolase